MKCLQKRTSPTAVKTAFEALVYIATSIWSQSLRNELTNLREESQVYHGLVQANQVLQKM